MDLTDLAGPNPQPMPSQRHRNAPAPLASPATDHRGAENTDAAHSPRPVTHTSLLHWLRARRTHRRSGDPDTDPRSLESILGQLEPNASSHAAPAAVSDSDWRSVVGLRVAERTYPQRIDQRGTLVIITTHSVWTQELSLMSSSICQRLQSRGYPITSLRFSVGSLPAPSGRFERLEVRRVAAPKSIPPSIRDQLGAIDDEKLRAVLASVISRSLSDT